MKVTKNEDVKSIHVSGVSLECTNFVSGFGETEGRSSVIVEDPVDLVDCHLVESKTVLAGEKPSFFASKRIEETVVHVSDCVKSSRSK